MTTTVQRERRYTRALPDAVQVAVREFMSGGAPDAALGFFVWAVLLGMDVPIDKAVINLDAMTVTVTL